MANFKKMCYRKQKTKENPKKGYKPFRQLESYNQRHIRSKTEVYLQPLAMTQT